MAHVMKECMLRWPTIPFLIVESRGTAAGFIRCLHDAGVASDQVSRILIAKNTPEMKKVYAITKVALVPSFVEPAGRVPVEAMLNGIPVVASNRGGLPEAMGDGGFVLPVWEDSTHSEHRVAIQRWAEQIGRLFEDEAFYADACERASRHVEPYRNGKVEQQRLETFEALARSR
jgi:glycosyltransferase involved in cell wall biosynthesis